MPRDLRTYLWEIEQAGNDIVSFTQNKYFADYEKDAMLKAAVERKFEIIGEALTQIGQHFPHEIGKLDNYRSFIGFRNILIHQYSSVDDGIVWGTVQSSLPVMRQQVTEWIAQLGLETPTTSSTTSE
jgi:uncharacterized protein with HEPN domain